MNGKRFRVEEVGELQVEEEEDRGGGGGGDSGTSVWHIQ